MNRSFVTRVALAVMAAAFAASAAQAATPSYEGYKSSYPQLHQLHVIAGMPDPDLKSSYPELHEVLSSAANHPAATVVEGSGIDWRDAALGALVGAVGAGLLAVAGALWLRRNRLPALH